MVVRGHPSEARPESIFTCEEPSLHTHTHTQRKLIYMIGRKCHIRSPAQPCHQNECCNETTFKLLPCLKTEAQNACKVRAWTFLRNKKLAKCEGETHELLFHLFMHVSGTKVTKQKMENIKSFLVFTSMTQLAYFDAINACCTIDPQHRTPTYKGTASVIFPSRNLV